MDPLAQVYTGQAGTGAAVLTTGHDFDVLDPTGIHWKNLEKKQAAQAAERQERDNVLSNIDKLAGTGWYPHREWINTRVDELRKHTTEAYQKGQDPTRGELGAKSANLKREIEEGIQTSQYLKGMYGDMRKLIDKDPDKYELDSFKEIEASLYDIDGVMSGQTPIGHLRTKKEQSKWFDIYNKIEPTMKMSNIENGKITIKSKRANRTSNITRLAQEQAQMDDITDIRGTYLPDEQIYHIKKYANEMPLIEEQYKYITQRYEARGEQNPLSLNQYANSIIEANELIESKAETLYGRMEDEAKEDRGWSRGGFQGDDLNVDRGGDKIFNIKPAKGDTKEVYSFDSYSLGGKKMDKPIKLDATKFINMKTGESVREGDVVDSKGKITKLGNNVVGDKDVILTNLMLLAVDRNGKIVAKNEDEIKESFNEGTVELKWFGEGTMYDTKTVKERGATKPTTTKIEKKVLIPYEDIKSKLKSSYGFNLDEREEGDISKFELGEDEFSDIFGNKETTEIDY